MGELDNRLRYVIHDADVPLTFRHKTQLAHRLRQMVDGWLQQKPTARAEFVKHTTKQIISDFKKFSPERPKPAFKPQLVDTLAFRGGTDRKVAARFLDALAKKAIKETRTKGAFVTPRLGTLVKTTRKARSGRNPQTGEPNKTPQHMVVKFRPAQGLKDAIASSAALPREASARKRATSKRRRSKHS